MLAKAAEVGKAEAILLGPAPEDAVADPRETWRQQDLPLR